MERYLERSKRANHIVHSRLVHPPLHLVDSRTTKVVGMQHEGRKCFFRISLHEAKLGRFGERICPLVHISLFSHCACFSLTLYMFLSNSNFERTLFIPMHASQRQHDIPSSLSLSHIPHPIVLIIMKVCEKARFVVIKQFEDGGR